MFNFRSFLNTDSPGIVEVWRKQPPFSRLARTISRHDLDLLVFGKPYFDPAGLIVAEKDEQVVGFAHAGFGPSADHSDLDYENGVICQLRTLPDQDSGELTAGLIDSAVDYLKGHGCTRCFAASQFPNVPFYLGLYGGSRIPGVVDQDDTMMVALKNNGFAPTEEIKIFTRQLSGFRAPVDRQQMTVRRQYQVSAVVDPLASTWWKNCMFGMAEKFAFRLVDRRTQQPVGNVDFWEIQPLSNEWGVRTLGMCDLAIDPASRRNGLATFLVAQALSQLLPQGFGVCEVQVRESNIESIGLFQKLGFENTENGTELSKQL